MFFNMRGLVAEYEREKIRERTMRGSREKARQGKIVNTGIIPFGFSYNKEKATLEEDVGKTKTLRFIFYTFANENLSLRTLAEKLNRLNIPTPRGGDRWRASTLGIMLRNEIYIGKLYQFRKYHVEPKHRIKPLSKSKKTSIALRPKEEWIAVKVPSLVPLELFEAVQRKLEKNARLSKRNTKRQYLLSGLLYCSLCGGRMGGHAIHGILYYRCCRKGNPDRFPIGPDGRPQPCTCPETQTELIESEVWNTVCRLIKDPDLLVQELHRQYSDNSQTKEILARELQLCQTRLKAIPKELRCLVEGYRKGLYADFMMREEMEVIQKEQAEFERRKADLERQLSQRLLAKSQEANIKKLSKKINMGLNNLGFTGKQEMLRLLIEKVFYNGQNIEIQTIIPLNEQLHPIRRGGLRG